jgi:hypothetical protein
VRSLTQNAAKNDRLGTSGVLSYVAKVFQGSAMTWTQFSANSWQRSELGPRRPALHLTATTGARLARSSNVHFGIAPWFGAFPEMDGVPTIMNWTRRFLARAAAVFAGTSGLSCP